MVGKNRQGEIIIAHNGKVELRCFRDDENGFISIISETPKGYQKKVPFKNIMLKRVGIMKKTFSLNEVYTLIKLQREFKIACHKCAINYSEYEDVKFSTLIMTGVKPIPLSNKRMWKSLVKWVPLSFEC